MEFKNISKVFSAQGTRFEYIFDVLGSLDTGIGNVIKGSTCEVDYIREKLRLLNSACEMVQHDTLVYLLRKGLVTDEEFTNIKKELRQGDMP